MATSLTYAEHRPPRDLAPWVACLWRIRGCTASATPFQHRVLPDGCADLLFDLEGARHAGGASSVDLVGPMSVAHVVELAGAIDVVGVRLRPGTVAVFGGVRADEVLDTGVPISLGVSPAQLAERQDNAVVLAPEVNARRAVDHARGPQLVEGDGAVLGPVIEALRSKVAALDGPDPLLRHALALWARAESPHFPSISCLTRDLGLSERAFERRFVANVGLTPVSYRRLARLRSVLRLHAAGSRGWASIAAVTGYSDQAHLVRDCRAFTGLTPTEWAATQVAHAGFLQDGAVTTV